MPLEIRLIKNSEYKAVNDFYNNACNVNRPTLKTKRNYNQFEWEFMNGPYGRAIYAAAWDVDDGKEPAIIGIQCVIPIKMISSDGKSLITAKGEDTLIDINASVKYKNIDILRELYNILFEECRKKEIGLVWGFNNMFATNKRLGFDRTVKSLFGLMVLKPMQAYKNIVIQKALNAIWEKLKLAIIIGISFLYSCLWKKKFFYSNGGGLQFNVEFNENPDLFIRAALPDHLFFIRQDKDYLKWRISENPYPVKYRSFQLLDHNNILQAQVICSINKNVAFIEQILFDRNLKIKIIYSLLKKAIRSLKQENICMIRYIGFQNNFLNKKEMAILKKIGFVFTKKGDQVCFINLSDELTFDPQNVYLSRLYKQGIN